MLRTLRRSNELDIKTKVALLEWCFLTVTVCCRDVDTEGWKHEEAVGIWSEVLLKVTESMSWKDKITNDSIRDPLQRHFMTVNTNRRKSYCSLSDTRLVKTVMIGMTDGTQSEGRPPRRWSDDIEEWNNSTLPEAVRLTDDRQTWRETVDAVTGLIFFHQMTDSNCDLQQTDSTALHCRKWINKMSNSPLGHARHRPLECCSWLQRSER